MGTRMRNGFTLFELLVVLGIVLVLAVLVIPVTLRMQEQEQATRAATALQIALGQARYRALQERQRNGLRLLVENGFVSQLEFVQDPGDFNDGYVVGPYNFHPVSGQPLQQTDPLFNRIIAARPPTIPPMQTFGDPSQGTTRVQPGDYVEFHGGGQLYRVETNPTSLGIPFSVYPPVLTTSPPRPALLVLDRKLTEPILAPSSGLSNYRIIRQPRPIPGEKPITLPEGTVIDISGAASPYFPYVSAVDYTPLPPALFYDIMFDPSGSLSDIPGDLLLLMIHDVPGPGVTNPTQFAVVAVYTKTGAIHSYPADLTSGDPFRFARLGRASSGP